MCFPLFVFQTCLRNFDKLLYKLKLTCIFAKHKCLVFVTK